MALHKPPVLSAAAGASALRWRLVAPLRAPGCGAASAPQRPRPSQPPRGPCAHYRFPHPVEPGMRLTGSKSKKVIRLWQGEVALKTSSRVRDELILLLALHPDGLLLDQIWPAMRRMVRARPDSYSPVNAGHMDKPDRTMLAVLQTAGYDSLKAFLATLPEVALTGEGVRVRAVLTHAELLASPPPQPTAENGPPLEVVRAPRLRDISAQLLGLGPDWRKLAAQRGLERAAARAAAQALLAQPAAPAVAPAAAPRKLDDGGVPADEAVAAQAAPPRLDRASRFPAWRRVRPPARAARGDAAPPPPPRARPAPPRPDA